MKDLKEQLQGYPAVFVVADSNVGGYAATIAPQAPHLEITADEQNKTLQTVELICRWLLEQGADRDALVLAVGGGVTTDLVGFAACIYKRGVRYANVPTTLLGQVDAGIGGKTGANLDSYKNILGVIRQPEFTFISPQPLNTLPEREFISGSAELLKTFIIGDAGLYERAVKLLKACKGSCAGLGAARSEELAFLISAAGAIKRRIVKADPYERGLRKILNFGHTYAHAIEWYQHSNGAEDPMTHGQAVAAGMVRAVEVSEAQGWCRHGMAKKISRDLQACGLPCALPCGADELRDAISRDKKHEAGQIHFVLLKDIGTVIVRKMDIDRI